MSVMDHTEENRDYDTFSQWSVVGPAPLLPHRPCLRKTWDFGGQRAISCVDIEKGLGSSMEHCRGEATLSVMANVGC